MAVNLITAPTEEALSIDDAKSFLGIEGTDDDARIERLIVSARQAFEVFCNRALISSTWELVLDWFPCCDIRIPALVSVTSLKYLDTAAAEQTLAATYYRVTAAGTDGGIGRVQLRYGQSWPSIYSEQDAVTLRYVAGWSDADAVPERVKDGMRAYVAEQYDGTDRSAVYENLWWTYRIVPI